MRLWHHPESDGLWWAEYCIDLNCDDVTDDARFQDAAAKRGLKCPGRISKLLPPQSMKEHELPEWDPEREIIPAADVARVIAPLTGGLAGAIRESYKKWDRKPSDFYPTPYDGTESLMPVIDMAFPEGARIWEPCSGDMDMVRVLEWHGHKVTATELRDTGQGITGFDFLRDDPVEAFGWEPDPDMIVMNPPFSLAREFIEKALSYTPNVACLVKIDYWNAISRYDFFQDHIPVFFFPLTFRLAFLKEERGNSPLMNTAWVVWMADEFRDFDGACVFEPMRKIVYPGYQGNGIRTSLAKLGQAVDDLCEALR
jgi:hypothetical protein